MKTAGVNLDTVLSSWYRTKYSRYCRQVRQIKALTCMKQMRAFC